MLMTEFMAVQYSGCSEILIICLEVNSRHENEEDEEEKRSAAACTVSWKERKGFLICSCFRYKIVNLFFCA